MKKLDKKSAVNFCHQVAAWSQLCFETFIQGKIMKFVIAQQPLKLEKIRADLESFEFY